MQCQLRVVDDPVFLHFTSRLLPSSQRQKDTLLSHGTPLSQSLKEESTFILTQGHNVPTSTTGDRKLLTHVMKPRHPTATLLEHKLPSTHLHQKASTTGLHRDRSVRSLLINLRIHEMVAGMSVSRLGQYLLFTRGEMSLLMELTVLLNRNTSLNTPSQGLYRRTSHLSHTQQKLNGQARPRSRWTAACNAWTSSHCLDEGIFLLCGQGEVDRRNSWRRLLVLSV